MDLDTKVSIEIWVDRVRTSKDSFVNFFILYMCLDAWMSMGSELGNDTGKKNWIKKEDNYLHRSWHESRHESHEALRELQRLSPVKDLSPSRRGDLVPLSDIDNFSEIFDFIYQIRCNLFHGGKMALSARNQNLVESSSKVLREWVECILNESL